MFGIFGYSCESIPLYIILGFDLSGREGKGWVCAYMFVSSMCKCFTLVPNIIVDALSML